MGVYIEDLQAALLLSQTYGLRACEIIEKNRCLKVDPADRTITIQGKGNRERTVHIRMEDYRIISDWYATPKSISYGTLYNRLTASAVLERGHKHRTVTHRGRKDRYRMLPEDASFREVVGLALELGHTVQTAREHYDTEQLEKVRRGRLLELLPK